MNILGVTHCSLVDDSYDEILQGHSPLSERWSLRLLGAYMHGRAYYEYHGFQPLGLDGHVHKYRAAQRCLYWLTVQNVYEEYQDVPAIQNLQRKFPGVWRLGELVSHLYGSVYAGQLDDIRPLQFLYTNCLQDYPDNYPESPAIQDAQRTVLDSTQFFKTYRE